MAVGAALLPTARLAVSAPDELVDTKGEVLAKFWSHVLNHYRKIKEVKQKDTFGEKKHRHHNPKSPPHYKPLPYKELYDMW
jgi:hypothetical protein